MQRLGNYRYRLALAADTEECPGHGGPARRQLNSCLIQCTVSCVKAVDQRRTCMTLPFDHQAVATASDLTRSTRQDSKHRESRDIRVNDTEPSKVRSRRSSNRKLSFAGPLESGDYSR
ncbi:hypothetical protein CY34DRAFT_742907 [Suillus luteus UH-Slu-Lm8-n1]|uniref:Uncharacterized protein n=1 Tax=Suillus luteus UH-Slu-Lm8-n1 TaxID=930992 RepID=A0A0D0AFH7_9AGAM|nr:hypothetical protein CY34DRAFT_742907 [Suillus luteus UH-Slu-Lm8-n1]